MTKIPVHHLNNWADFGLDMGHTSYPGAREMLEGFEAHRDDCYSFLLVETGGCSMDVDFITVDLPEAHIYPRRFKRLVAVAQPRLFLNGG